MVYTIQEHPHTPNRKTYFLYSKEMTKTQLNSCIDINCNELET